MNKTNKEAGTRPNEAICQGNQYMFNHKFYGLFRGFVTDTGTDKQRSPQIEVMNTGLPIKRTGYDPINKRDKMFVNMGLVTEYRKI